MAVAKCADSRADRILVLSQERRELIVRFEVLASARALLPLEASS
jgi:hypothetical protein